MSDIKSKRETRLKIGLYLTSSALTGLLYLTLFFILTKVIRLSVLAAVTITYISSMSFYFIANKLVVFRKLSPGKLKKELFQYIIVAIVNYLITVAIVKSLYLFTQEAFSGTILAGIVTVSMTYFIFDNVLFKKSGSD
jgi:putative flippase GtrA